MYEARFGLNTAPFRLLPDPRFYLDAGAHRDAVETLMAGLARGERLLWLDGPTGCGKSAAAQRLGARLRDIGRAVAVLAGAEDDTPTQVLARAASTSTSTLAPDGGLPVLIIDEAQRLSPASFAAWQAAAADAGSPPAWQAVLVGDPLPVPKDETVAHARLRPLSAAETHTYLLHRLQRAGWSGRPDWQPAASAAIHARSDGVPRRIHLLADRVLLQASLSGDDAPGPALVEAVADERQAELASGALGGWVARPVDPAPARPDPVSGAATRIEPPAPSRRYALADFADRPTAAASPVGAPTGPEAPALASATRPEPPPAPRPEAEARRPARTAPVVLAITLLALAAGAWWVEKTSAPGAPTASPPPAPVLMPPWAAAPAPAPTPAPTPAPAPPTAAAAPPPPAERPQVVESTPPARPNAGVATPTPRPTPVPTPGPTPGPTPLATPALERPAPAARLARPRADPAVAPGNPSAALSCTQNAAALGLCTPAAAPPPTPATPAAPAAAPPAAAPPRSPDPSPAPPPRCDPGRSALGLCDFTR